MSEADIEPSIGVDNQVEKTDMLAFSQHNIFIII